VGAEIALEKRNSAVEPTFFAFNPKGAPTSVLAPAVADVFPHARHLFMYRACHKVVDSFTGLIFPQGVTWKMWMVWRLLGLKAIAFMGGSSPPEQLGAVLRNLSSLPVAGLTNRWIAAVSAWVKMVEERRTAIAGADPIAEAPSLRMDEFTSKDLAVRAQVMRDLLDHLGLVHATASDEARAPALAVFSVHSQAGSAMAGSKAKVVQEADVPFIQQAVEVGLAELGSAGVVVEKGGANVVLPRSIGVKV